MYNILPYTGKIEAKEDIPNISPSSNVILKVTKIVSSIKNFILVFDNWFILLDLVFQLKHLGIFLWKQYASTD